MSISRCNKLLIFNKLKDASKEVQKKKCSLHVFPVLHGHASHYTLSDPILSVQAGVALSFTIWGVLTIKSMKLQSQTSSPSCPRKPVRLASNQEVPKQSTHLGAIRLCFQDVFYNPKELETINKK